MKSKIAELEPEKRILKAVTLSQLFSEFFQSFFHHLKIFSHFYISNPQITSSNLLIPKILPFKSSALLHFGFGFGFGFGEALLELQLELEQEPPPSPADG